MLGKAADACREIQKSIPDFKISFNLSYIQVLKSNALDEILSFVETADLEPGSIIVELTDLNPSIIKIDRSFTIKALRNDYEYNLLRHMADMTHSIGSKFCIEGIETKEELDRISSINPDYIQGYYYGRPCPLGEFMDKFILK